MRQRDGTTNFGDCQIHPSAKLCAGALIGKPFRKLLDGSQEESAKTVISENAYIGYYSIIGSGCEVGSGTIVDDYCVVESHVVIGRETLLIYRAQVCNDVRIGDNCVIGGLIGERTIVGNRCRVFGHVVHSQHNPRLGWDDEEAMEDAPIIKDDVFIGFGAIVAGNVTIERRVYICVNAVITKDIPEGHIGFGINQIVHFSEWRGRLRDSLFFLDERD